MNRPAVARFGAAAATGVLLAAARPPLDLGPLACVAFIPLFVAWRDRGPRGTAALAFVAAAFYYAILMSWSWYFGTIAIVPLVIALGTYWAVAGAVLGFLRHGGIANPFLVAAVWVLAEATVARVPLGGFSWGEVGFAFHDVGVGRALSSVGGVELVTFVAVVLNAFLADAVIAAWNRAHVSRSAWSRLGAGLAVVVVVPFVAAGLRTAPHPTGRLRVAILQGNDKNRDLTQAEEDARYLPNSHFRLAARVRDPVDLVIFPESSMDADPRTDRYLRRHLVAVAEDRRAWVLANAVADAPAEGDEPAGTKASNLNVLFDPDGRVEGTYAKRHLVPFGEYVPFRSALEGWISALDRVPRDFEPGDGPGIFAIGGHAVATIVCFESAFGYQVRPLVHDGAEVIVVSTNNRSYERSANSAQHVAIGQLRAAETGRPVVQAAISGISAIIDADGEVHERTDLFDRTVLEATITTTGGQTPYVRYGEWIVWTSGLLLAGAAALSIRRNGSRPRSRKRRAGFVDSPALLESPGDTP